MMIILFKSSAKIDQNLHYSVFKSWSRLRFLVCFWFTLFFFMRRMINSCISFACFLLASIWVGVKWFNFVESIFSSFWEQNLQTFTIGRQISVQNTKIAENGVGKYSLLGQSKNSIQTLVTSHFQYSSWRFWNFWIVEFISVIVKFSKMKMAITWYRITMA